MRRSIWATLLAMLLSLLLTQVARAASVEKTWGLGNEPFGVTIDPRTGTVFVAISDHNNWSGPEYMWAIDPTAPYPPYDPYNLPRFQLPRAQVMSVLDTDPEVDRLFVATNAGIAVVDPHTHAVVGMMDVRAVGLDLDPSTHHLYAAGTSTGAAVIDARTGEVLAQSAAPSGNDFWWMAAHDAVRHRVYVTNGNNTNPSLVVLNDSDLALIATIPLPAIPRFALNVDVARGLVYVGGFSWGSAAPGSLYVIDESSLSIVRTVNLATGVASPFWSTLDPSTDTLYVSLIATPGYPGNALAVVDLSTLTVTSRMALSFQPGQSALHPDGRLYVTEFDKARLAAIKLTNSAPVVDSVTVSTLTPRTNDVVTASVVAHDPDGDPLSVSYQWWVNSTNTAGQQHALPGETSPTLDLSKPGNGDLDDLLCLSYAVSDGQAQVGDGNLWCFAFVVDTAPTVAVSLTPTTPLTNSSLQATATGADVDGTALTYTYTWRTNGAVRRTVTTASAVDTFDLAQSSNGDKGDAVSVDVTASDGRLSSAATVASATVANSSPAASVALSSTMPRKRDVVVATATGTDADFDVLTYTYTWRVNGKVKQTATTSATDNALDLRVIGAENGDSVTVEVVVSDGSATATASGSATVTPPGH